ncbi:MAG: T9SS type A sorting domain-containing protein [Candidatus Eisenbacteria bacterium]|nr:T9SS type A sorting domain-containing protein [Candidatus Eisenbacteria bacterium]
MKAKALRPFYFALLTLIFVPALCSAAWVNYKRLTSTTWESGITGGHGHPVQATLSGNVHIVWHDYGGGAAPQTPQVYWRKFSKAGAVWGDTVRVSRGTGLAVDPVTALSPNESLFIFWRDRRSGSYSDIYHRSLSVAGVWDNSDTMLVRLSSVSSALTATSDSDGNIFLLWTDSGEVWQRIYCKRRFSSTGWEAGDICVSENPGGSTSAAPSAASDKLGNVYVVWADDRAGNWEIYCRAYMKDVGWEAQPRRITTANGISTNPSVACDGIGNVHVVWSDNRGGPFAIYYKKKSLGAPQWGRDRVFSKGTGDAGNPTVAADENGGVFVAWEDSRNLGIGTEIYFRAFTADGGLDPDDTRITVNYGTSWSPSLSLDGSGSLHLVWADNSEGNLEIYYAKGTGMAAVDAQDVELSAVPSGNCVILKWKVGWSPFLRGLSIIRKDEDGNQELILDREIHGSGKGDCIDEGILPGHVYEYRAVLTGSDGTFLASRSLRLSIPLWDDFIIFPNPSTGRLTFEFTASRRGSIRLIVFDVRGRMVSSFEPDSGPGERSRFDWVFPRENRASGIYVAVLVNGDKRVAKKFVLID